MKSFEVTYTPRRLPEVVLHQLIKVATTAHIHYTFPPKDFVMLEIKELENC
jgi:hypothetical protein